MAGHPAAAFGTLGYTVGDTTYEAKHTTPFGEELAEMFARAREAGLTHVAMEVSSHSLEQERVAGIEFSVGVFTNLTQDHLDFHKNMDAYRRAKLRLFERIEGPGRFTVVNVEDPSAEAFRAASKVPCYTCGEGGDCRAEDIALRVNRTEFTARTPWGDARVSMRLLGRHNVSNALGVIAVCAGLGVPMDTIAEGLADITVPGRFEHVDAGQDFQVIVDYAHTDDGLLNVLRGARAICDGRIYCVFGCGGDRDRTKRPKMARASAGLADFTVVTSDNPRTEDPLRIIEEIEAGMRDAGKRRDEDYLVIPDRTSAIRRAIEMARPGDLVLIAGKGHEDYQIIGTEKIHFDDREVARNILEGR
jgi:UDP-N-acetylmuramoyl-L-alanyl-D-glutamate--2,6-diaminopimelate ligase